MTNKEYHAALGVSKSDLDLINISPLHYRTKKEEPTVQTEAMLLGSALHKMALETADFFSEFAVAPVCDRRTKDGKAIYAEFAEKSVGKDVISAEQYAKIHAMTQALFDHPLASKLLSGGKAEQSYFWKDDDTICKCRPDYLKGNYCIDLKTTQSAKPSEFMKSAYHFRYHVQAYWYLKGLKACHVDVTDFIFVAVEKEPPYAVCVYVAGEDFLTLGERDAERNLTIFKKCMESGIWYGYDENPEVHSLELPAWARKELYNE